MDESRGEGHLMCPEEEEEVEEEEGKERPLTYDTFFRASPDV